MAPAGLKAVLSYNQVKSNEKKESQAFRANIT